MVRHSIICAITISTLAIISIERAIPQNRQNQFIRNNFGGALGGPLPFILKDKAFIFLSYEGLRQTQALLLTSNVPTLAQRALFAKQSCRARRMPS